jgi:CRISPR system Cascade subunit CasB
MSGPTGHELAYTNYLRSLAGERIEGGDADTVRSGSETTNRAALAALRRGLGKNPGEAPEMFPYVVRWLSEEMSEWTEKTYYLTASLFAWHPETWPGGARHNLGVSMARVREDASESTELRFVALLNAHRDDLAEHLRSVVGLCRSHDVPVDWAELLSDLKYWTADNRAVQRRWARSYWTPLDASKPHSDAVPLLETPV